MILKVMVISKGGLLCYSKRIYGQNEVNDDLVSGFLTAISSFSQEIKGGVIESLNLGNFNYIYEYDKIYEFNFIVITNKYDLEHEAKSKVELMKKEFIKKYQKYMKSWNGDVNIFRDFDKFIEDNISIPPKILIIGESGVGKTTILDLFPGDTILELDEDMKEVIQKPVELDEFTNIKYVTLREIDLEEIIDNSMLYSSLLDSVNVIFIVTNSSASNLSRTQNFISRLKPKVKNADYYIIANFQDLKDLAFEPIEIEKATGIKTFGFTAIQDNSKNKIMAIITETLKTSLTENKEEKKS